MHPPWEKTFDWLGTTGNRAAVELLLRALKSGTPQIRRAALLALMRRPEKNAHLVVLRDIDRTDDCWQDCLRILPGTFQEFLRDQLVHGDPHQRQEVCRFLVDTDQFDFVPLLAHLLENRKIQPRDALAGTLQALCRKLGTLVEAASAGNEATQIMRTAEQVRRALNIAADRYAKHEAPEILESLLLLSAGYSRLFLEIIRQPGHAARSVLLHLLSTDTSSATLKVLCDFLHQADAPQEVLRIISQRSDLPFLRHLLHSVKTPLSTTVRRHLKSLRSLKWLDNLEGLLPSLDETEQSALVEIVVHSGVPRQEALRVVGKVLTKGLPGARRTAAEALADFHGAEANELALRAMSDPDPLVQAAILPQLRQRGVVGALPHIIRLLESPHPAVRKAARKSLREFSFSRFLQVWDLLPADIRQNTGMLVKRVDGRTSLLLRAELLSPFRLRRLRALSVAQELHLVPRVESAIIPLLKDEDHAVRAEAAAALAQSDSVWSYQALVDALEDPNAVVRAIAQRSLELRRQRQELAERTAQGTEKSSPSQATPPVSSSADAAGLTPENAPSP